MDLRVNLKDLWYGDLNSLPEFVWEERCIYRMVNLVNGKNYIGQTRSRLIDRWRLASGNWCHYECCRVQNYNRHIYNSIRKYTENNFEVVLLEYNLDPRNLIIHEIYWIDKFDSFGVKGYNGNSGGGGCEHLSSKEVNDRRSSTNRLLYGNGVDSAGQLHTPEARIKAVATRKLNGQYVTNGVSPN